MQRISNWESVQAAGEFEQLELGGHVCKILKAEETTTRTGRPALRLYFDISDGKQAGYFKRRFDSDDRPDKKWPNGGQFLQLTDGKSISYFKGLLTSIENSNPGYKWDWDETKLRGKLFGGVFGREQYEKQDGSLAFATKCMKIRSTDGIQDVPAPADKLKKGSGNSGSGYGFSAFTEMPDDDGELPF